MSAGFADETNVVKVEPEAPAASAFVPGVSYGMPEDVYRAIPALGSSDVKALIRSPAHYLAGLDAQSESTDAQELGTAIHVGVLEPERFERAVLELPDVDRRTKAGRETIAAIERENPGAILLAPESYLHACRAIDAVRSHPAAAHLLSAGLPEVVLQWEDPETGTPCKARLDWLRPDMATPDLKSTRDASPGGFVRAIGTLGYAIQEAHYRRGMRAVMSADPPLFPFIAVEKEPPYAVGVYVIDDEAREAADARVAQAMRRHRECRESGAWPAYSDLIEVLTLPRWAL